MSEETMTLKIIKFVVKYEKCIPDILGSPLGREGLGLDILRYHIDFIDLNLSILYGSGRKFYLIKLVLKPCRPR